MPDLATAQQRRRLFLDIALRRCRPGSGSHPTFLRQRTWHRPVSDLRHIFLKTSFVIVGGIATRLYMPERMTDDLDILIHDRDLNMAQKELNQAGATWVGNLRIGGSSWRLTDETLLDVLCASDPWVEEAIAHPQASPEGLPVIALPYLVLMKLRASRSIDLGDLSRMLGGADPQSLTQVRQTIATYLPDASEDLESLIFLGGLEMQEPS